jgi:hypothetical protein
MKIYNYFYCNEPISKENWDKCMELLNIPYWRNSVVDGVFTYGYYKAVEVENE